MRRARWLPVLLLAFAASPARGTNFQVGIGDDCPGVFSASFRGCFSPTPLTIGVGDTVTFYSYADSFDTGPHNVVADDGSFRCARGCDGEGGDGTPADANWSFTRTLLAPGDVHYHDEASGTTGLIVVVNKLVIGPAISGAWYDLAQSGHGLFIEVLPGNRFSAAWLTFNPAGSGQAWFAGIGSYSPGSNTATITDVEMPVGGHWIPYFNLTSIVPLAWGTLSFTFDDCDHGRVDFASPLGYGSGSMSLTRLTQPAGLTCP